MADVMLRSTQDTNPNDIRLRPKSERYWVGGNTTPNFSSVGPTNWSYWSGGPPNAPAPNANGESDVYIDGNSGAGLVQADGPFQARSMDFLGFVGTFGGGGLALGIAPQGLNLLGAGEKVQFRFSSGMSLASLQNTDMRVRANLGVIIQLTSAGKTNFAVELGNAAGNSGTVQLMDALNLGTSNISTGAASLNTQGFPITCANIVGIGVTPAVAPQWDIRGSAITLTNSLGTTWPASPATTFLSDTSTSFTITVLTNNGAGITLPTILGDITLNGPTTNVLCAFRPYPLGSASWSCRNLTIIPNAFRDSGCLFGFGTNYTITGTFTCNGNSLVNRFYFGSNDYTISGGAPKHGSSYTITAAAISLSNLDFADCQGAGAAAPFTGTSFGDCQGNSGITFDSPVTLFWFSNNGNFEDASKWFLGSGGTGGAGRIPLPQDNIRFDANSFSTGSQIVATNSRPRLCKNLDFTGVTNSPTFRMEFQSQLYGDLTIVSGMSFITTNANFTLILRKRGTISIVMNGKSFPCNVCLDAPGGSWTMTEAVTIVGTSNAGFLLCAGTFDSAGFSITTPRFGLKGGSVNLSGTGTASSNVQLTASMRASVVTITGSTIDSNVIFVGVTTLFTWDAGTSLFKFTGSSASNKNYNGGGLTWYDWWFAGNLGAGTNTITGSNTFHDFKIDTAGTYILNAGFTQTMTTWTVNGTDRSNRVTLQSNTAGSAWNLSVASGVVMSSFLSLKDSHAAGGATFRADTSIDVSGNTGWVFGVFMLGSAGIARGVGSSTLSTSIVMLPQDGVLQGVFSHSNLVTSIVMDPVPANLWGHGIGAFGASLRAFGHAWGVMSAELDTSIVLVADGELLAQGGSPSLDTAIVLIATGMEAEGHGVVRLFVSEDFIDDVVYRLEQQGLGVEGTSIFKSSSAIPKSYNGIYSILVRETGGFSPTRIQNKDGAATIRPTAQIIVRAATYSSARRWARLAYKALDGVFNTTILRTFYLSMTAQQEPTDYGKDGDGETPTVGFNIQAEREPNL